MLEKRAHNGSSKMLPQSRNMHTGILSNPSLVVHEKSPEILQVSLVTVDLTSFDGLMYEHTMHDLPHECVPVF